MYTFGPTFRAEKSNTKRHLSEFWMIEPEVISDQAVNVAVDYLKHVGSAALNKNPDDLNFLHS